MDNAPRRLVELTTHESLGLLGRASFGRIVFTLQALPAIRPINHIVDRDAVIVRTHLGAAMSDSVGVVVAYQADDIHPVEHVGWSVTLTGIARLVHDPDEVARYRGLLRPWVNGQRDEIIRIQPELVTGYRLTTRG